MPSKLTPGTIGTAELSELLSITDRRIQQLAEQGILERTARGLYVWPDAVQRYCEWIRTRTDPDEKVLKIKERELRCQRLEQQIDSREDQRRDEVRAEFAAVLTDCWAEYRQLLNRTSAPFTAAQRAELNECATRAAEQAAERFEGKHERTSTP